MKLPVACRQINTSGKWLVYDKGASNYRDVTCPPGYQFDVPRTAQENQQLYRTLLQYWNTTAPPYYASLMDRQRREQQAIELARLRDPFRELLDKETVKTAAPHVKRQDIYNDGDVIDSEGQGSSLSTSTALPNEHGRQSAPANASGNGDGQTPVVEVKGAIEPAPPLKAVTGVPGGGMIWIDISSWQTAGCWVPGGVHGRCPYQDPDNTVALQEIIKVSTIGGVIILVLAGMFLYLKCRRNVRLSKDNKRRAMVRDKIMQTEVETVPA
ncbi:hypothetical protein BGX34_004972 [Mortierella sp. NVP85]|nr:hypothetical protein BGX34_004972 [Mortierella sp. NVP85]